MLSGTSGVGEAEITVMPATEATPDKLVGLASIVPFLSDRRIVLVEGLIGSIDPRQRTSPVHRRGSTTRQLPQDPKINSWLLKTWAEAANTLAQIPPFADLIFVEGKLRINNWLLQNLKSVAKVQEFRPLLGRQLESWINRRVNQQGGKISPNAVRLLTILIGSDLHLQSNEIEKLVLYCSDRYIEETDIRVLVNAAQELGVYSVVDAVLEKNALKAFRLACQLLDEGFSGLHLLNLLTRQIRNVILAKDLAARNLPLKGIGNILGVTSDYVLKKTTQQASVQSEEYLRALHTALLETDISIKTGKLPERLAVETFMAKMYLERTK